ncbi:hypothetical protein ACN38_g2834 [Penicillium nordicum]|uniref:Uncharacterized protein n=1 Tax=Penicillium nordicum TaxID=229535 RepID=A0A0N0RZJ4_9EURO|nr:hypothetical protein ACN38_g2834 [Penicillium nordicum]
MTTSTCAELLPNSGKSLTPKLRKAWLRMVRHGRVKLCGDRDLAAEIASSGSSNATKANHNARDVALSGCYATSCLTSPTSSPSPLTRCGHWWFEEG